MQEWQKISLVLCTYGVLKELRPSEPFITEYIIDFKNLTADEVIHVAFPVSTYSSWVATPFGFLLTDFLRYRPVVIFEGLTFAIMWGTLILASSLQAILVVEALYGIACSAEVAYYTYIYAQVDKEHYAKVTSYTSSAIYIGKFIGGVMAQILVTVFDFDYHFLTYLTFLFSLLGLSTTIFLPKVRSSLYFNQDACIVSDTGSKNNNKTGYGAKLKVSGCRIWEDLKHAYSNSYVLKWSLWWALSAAGQYQTMNYVQALWEKINEEDRLESYNGLVKAVHTLFSAAFCFCVGYMSVSWRKWGESLIATISFLQAFLVILMSQSSHMYAAYAYYIVFRTMHPIMQTIASSEIAHGIKKDSHGLLFGMNIFIALFFQTVLTFGVSDKRGLSLDVQSQFFVYGLYYFILGIVFLAVSCRSCLNSSSLFQRK